MQDDQARRRIERLFHEAVSLPSVEQGRFLRDHCKDENERAEIEKLLKYDAVAGNDPTDGLGAASNRGIRQQRARTRLAL